MLIYTDTMVVCREEQGVMSQFFQPPIRRSAVAAAGAGSGLTFSWNISTFYYYSMA